MKASAVKTSTAKATTMKTSTVKAGQPRGKERAP